MSMEIPDRAPLAALRRSVFGFLLGTAVGAAFVALVGAFGFGLPSAGPTPVPLADLALLPVTFGLLGLVVAPAFGRGFDGGGPARR